ncbi:MAG: alginate export family protein [Candidatus Omnitrophica bacterium]|nr:alginate export family protein [Candidatus Omnitrophota bacterium]
MLKATQRGAVLLGLTALGLSVCSVPGFAEVQNVKVSGDVTVRAFIMSTTGINIGADLTENVSAFVRIANERDWDSTSTTEAAGDIDLSQAYVTLKELFYSPLTLKLGLQPITWGRGFVLGSNLFPSVNAIGNDRNGAITANEFTDFTAFDAIRATLDLSNLGGLNLPLSAEYVFIKIDENTVGASDDINIQGVNFSSTLDAWSSELEAYYLNKRDKSTVPTGSSVKSGSVNTLGVRGTTQPLKGASVYGELAYQYGSRPVDPAGVLSTGDALQAWGVDLGGEYTFAGLPTSPMLGTEWRFYSGKRAPDGRPAGGWTVVAPGYFRTALREFQTQSTVAGFYPNDAVGVTSSGTNQHEVAIYGSFNPLEDLTISPRLSWFILDEGARGTVCDLGGCRVDNTTKRNRFLGTEWDTNVVYNYTDDVQLGLLYALFAPGSVFRTPNDDTAQELITTVSVKF